MEYPLNHSMGIAFSYKNLLEVIMKPYQRGFMVLWNQKSILVSSNSGEPHPVEDSTSGDGHRLGTPGFCICARGDQRGSSIAQLFFFSFHIKKQNTSSSNLGLAGWSGSPKDPPVGASFARITNQSRLLHRC
jgi:hypothetical protein